MWDHPRSRGVYRYPPLVALPERGSSPLARGLLPGPLQRLHPLRIIPARAGFTAAGNRYPTKEGDHPRSRGVYLLRSTMNRPLAGSSPLARGLRYELQGRQVRYGIIPARAGFTTGVWPSGTLSPDHPRSRGVYAFWADVREWESGSSPLARGLHGTINRARLTHGIIPARAGFTASTCRSAASSRDHPRSRGVYHVYWDVRTPCPGSSPLARGLLQRRRLPHRGRGIIPARAGFTGGALQSHGQPADHPRSRGVYVASR